MAMVVPPPVLDRSLQQALMGFAQPFARGLEISGQRGLQRQDLASIIAHNQTMQQYQQAQQQYMPQAAGAAQQWGQQDLGPLGQALGAQGQPFPQIPQEPQFPAMRSQRLADIQGQMELAQALSPEGQYGRPPWWVAGATPEQVEAYRERVGGPLVQFGKEPWTGEYKTKAEKAAEVEAEHARKVGISPARLNSARKSAVDIIDRIPDTWTDKWIPGKKNFSQGELLAGYENYRTQNNYVNLTPQKRKVLDDIWDNQIKTYNKIGYADIGRNEFAWNPKHPDVQKVRRQKNAIGDISRMSDAELRRIAGQ